MEIPDEEGEPLRMVNSWDLRALTGEGPRQKVSTKVVISVAKSPMPTPNLSALSTNDNWLISAFSRRRIRACGQERFRKTGSDTLLSEASRACFQSRF